VYGIELISPPEVILETYENTRKNYESVKAVYEPGDGTLSLPDAGWILDKTPLYAADYAAYQKEEEEGEAQSESSSSSPLADLINALREEEPEAEQNASEPEESPVDELAEELEEKLDERIAGKDSFTTEELRELIAWVAEEAGISEEHSVDGTETYAAGESLLEKLHTVARHEFHKAEEQVRKVERQIIEKRRKRVLPDEKALEKIARYEAHLSREMYRALHELEAPQTRRAGGSAPLGRLDVSG
jgi:hypothetical protein